MRLIFIVLLCLFSQLPPPLLGAPVIEITRGQVKPEPISLVPTYSNDDSSLAKDIDQVIQNDLDTSGAFKIMDPKGFIQDNQSLIKGGIQYNSWHITKTRFIYFAKLSSSGGKVTVDFELHDVVRAKKMASLKLDGDHRKWRRIAHMIADFIYHQVTGEDGFFNTQIAFVEPTNERGKNHNTCLKVMDIDGDKDSIFQLTDGKKLVLTPRYSPDGKSIAYLILDKNKGEVYIADLMTKSSKLMGKYDGLNFAPRYSPDGRSIVFSIAKNGSTAIYKQDLYTRQLTQITNHTNIDTSPCYSPDGKKIVFVSDRAGKPTLYTMNADGSDQVRISFGKGSYMAPCWSPRGDMIAYMLQKGGQFYIGIMHPDGSGERLIATGYLVEEPIWTSNGRFLIFTVQQSVRDKQYIVRMDLTGKHQYQVKTPGEACGPALSPLLGSAIPK
ncbi:MAG: Tol-Pal system protein TolB [Proteobacteria bacterium]|nr:Tol-Pal system protein TolB [Pseudomonadota bacterium]